MKLVKIIAVATIAITLTVQAAQAGSLLTGTSSSNRSLLGNSNTTGSSLLRSYEETNTNTNNKQSKYSFRKITIFIENIKNDRR